MLKRQRPKLTVSSYHSDTPIIEKISLLVAEGHVTYEYTDLLERINKLLKDKNPGLAEGGKSKKDEDPYVVRLGTTKTAW